MTDIIHTYPFLLKDCSIIEVYSEEYLALHLDRKQEYELSYKGMQSFGKVSEKVTEEFDKICTENPDHKIAIGYDRYRKIKSISSWDKHDF